MIDPPEDLFAEAPPPPPVAKRGPGRPRKDDTGDIRPPRNLARGREAKKLQSALTARFLSDMLELWEDQGESIMRRAAFNEPTKVLQIFANLLPRQIEMSVTQVQEIDDDKLGRLIDAIDGVLTGGARSLEGQARGGTLIEIGAEEAVVIPAVSEAEGLPR